MLGTVSRWPSVISLFQGCLTSRELPHSHTFWGSPTKEEWIQRHKGIAISAPCPLMSCFSSRAPVQSVGTVGQATAAWWRRPSSTSSSSSFFHLLLLPSPSPFLFPLLFSLPHSPFLLPFLSPCSSFLPFLLLSSLLPPPSSLFLYPFRPPPPLLPPSLPPPLSSFHPLPSSSLLPLFRYKSQGIYIYYVYFDMISLLQN